MCKKITYMSNFSFYDCLVMKMLMCWECFLSLYMTVIVRDLNYYQESEYLEFTISSWKVGFLLHNLFTCCLGVHVAGRSSHGLVRRVPRAWDAPVLLHNDCGAGLVYFGGHRCSRAWLLDRSWQIAFAALAVPYYFIVCRLCIHPSNLD